MPNLKSPRAKQIKDISESLGKLPPQALEMEEAVLGALLTESDSIGLVAPFLQASHFYLDKNQRIYTAIMSLHRSGAPIDLRTVIVELRRTGHLEGAGGASELSRLSTVVSLAANIEYHARIVVEMAIKREMIMIASRMHEQGYDDTADVWEFVESSMEKIKALYVRETQPSVEEKIQQLWKQTVVTEEPPPDVPVIKIDGQTMCSLTEHSMLMGPKKSRKTLFIILLVKWALEYRNVRHDEIQIYDTEQGRRHIYLMREKIRKLTGKYVNMFSLRGKDPLERREFITNTLKYWPKPAKLVIVDGIRDLMSNINDPDETVDVIKWVETTIAGDLHLINVLHTNKNDQNPRGHLGTELWNKAQTTIKLDLTKTGETEVTCDASRDKPFSPFIFSHSPEGLPDILGIPAGGETVTPDDTRTNLLLIFEDGTPMGYNDLKEEVKIYFKVGENKAKQLINDFRKKGWVVSSGKAHSRDSLYKIMIQPGQPDPPPLEPPIVQTEMFSSNGHHQEPPPMDLPPPEEPPWAEEELEL